MRIFAIETSCDETALSFIEAHGSPETGDFSYTVLGETLLSQAALHAQYGGVFPNLAKREHAKNLTPLLIETLTQAGSLKSKSDLDSKSDFDFETLLEREPELLAQLRVFMPTYGKPDIDALAVTVGPGLEPALWVGINFAKALSLAWDLPIIPVNHMEGHLLMALVQNPSESSKPEKNITPHSESVLPRPGLEQVFPLVALLVSGGHTELILSEQFGSYKILGETRDDAAGECFDKCARIIGLPYPGGPEISKLAAIARSEFLEERISSLPRPMIHEKSYEFSFSGLKTAVRNAWANDTATWESETHKQMAYALEIENAIVEVLVKKTMYAVSESGAVTLVVSGGVSANTHLKETLQQKCVETSIQLLTPTPSLATDNARMIAITGYLHQSETAESNSITAQGQLRLG
ncbi:MAG: tRNA (adenosine(37)-N6)-threonylcarbamoyltransferase complex transferase subunit TsaD [Candidatus Nitrotoga sp.]